MLSCVICGSLEFYTEAGYFYCQECQTQSQEKREEILEIRVDPSTRLRKTRIRRDQSTKSAQEIGWTSWELYNFIIIGLTNELIELGAPMEMKLTVLQLWSTYLRKLEVAFTSTTKQHIPKLARKYNKKDATIIYGKIQQKKKNRKRKRGASSTSASSLISTSYMSEGSSVKELNKQKKILVAAEYDRYIQSQASSEADAVSVMNQSLYSLKSNGSRSSTRSNSVQFNKHAKMETKKMKEASKKLPLAERRQFQEKYIRKQYLTSPEMISPAKLWAILYLALRIHDQQIHLGDMLRYVREGHLSYYKMDHLIPPEIVLTKSDLNIITQTTEVTHKAMRNTSARMAKFLEVREITCPYFLPLISRYCQELQLPRGVLLYTERLIALAPPKMVFTLQNTMIPNYEARAMAFIIVVLKLLFGLDGITEYEISRFAETTNHSDVPQFLSKISKGKIQKPASDTSPCIIVHGGAGEIVDSKVVEKILGCQKSASIGYKVLLNGGNSLEAIEAALWWLENDEYFNCGYGSVLNKLGEVQMDACLMDGTRSISGCVAAVSDIEHPISLAKFVLENYPNTIVVGDGAKALAKNCAGMNWLSKGTMVAPEAYQNSQESKYISENSFTDLTKNKHGTVGCVAWDGFTMAAGTSTGGLPDKTVGRVGDSPLLGCGTFANSEAGCSLTGHGESVIKLGMSRSIVSDIIEGCDADEALKRNLDGMSNKLNSFGGGIVLQKCGCWKSYCTTSRMPYAIVKNDLIIFGADVNEKRIQKYEHDTEMVAESGRLESTLFSFCEWQRYIECRKALITKLHFPTKLKYEQDLPSTSHLYLGFLKLLQSKKESDDTEAPKPKVSMPQELSNAMSQSIDKLNQNSLPLNEGKMFAPSLTPQYSYLEQLLENSDCDIPNLLRSNFVETKIAYTTKPEIVKNQIFGDDVNLKVIDSNMHFVEKLVPPFKQVMFSLKELNQFVPVGTDDSKKNSFLLTGDDLTEYLYRNNIGKLKMDMKKLSLYDSVQNSLPTTQDLTSECWEDFAFNEILPNGKLIVHGDSDMENDDDETSQRNDSSSQDNIDNFYDKYNLEFSSSEKEAILDSPISKNPYNNSRIMYFDSSGNFVKSIYRNHEGIKAKVFEMPPVEQQNCNTDDSDSKTTAINVIAKKKKKKAKVKDPNNPINLNDDEISILNGCIGENASKNFSLKTEITDNLKLFRPYSEYWMYHCELDVGQQTFELFEKELPTSFRWLLNECASVIEVTTENLYNEVCLIESYHGHILNPSYLPQNNIYAAKNCKAKSHYNSLKRRW